MQAVQSVQHVWAIVQRAVQYFFGMNFEVVFAAVLFCEILPVRV